MKTLFLILPLLLIASLTRAGSTGKYIDKGIVTKLLHGFSIDKPQGWHSFSKNSMLDNLSKFEFSETEMQALLKNDQGSVLLASYMKYDPKTYPGLIPTIQVNMRKNPAPDYPGLKQAMVSSTVQFKQLFDNFKVTDGPYDIEVGGHKTCWFLATFDMKTQAGNVLHVRSWTYGIFNGDHFYQLNFSDEINGPDDCKALYAEVLKSVKIQ